jgi:hypothetical protein
MRRLTGTPRAPTVTSARSHAGIAPVPCDAIFLNKNLCWQPG